MENFQITVKKALFGSEIEFILKDIEEEIAKDFIEEAYQEGIRLQKIFNIYNKNSDLSLLNKERKRKMPEEFIYVLNEALKMCKETNGAYDISLGAQFLERKNGKEIPKLACSYKDIEIIGNVIELKNKEVIIDLGSIAKGYITDKMADFLQSKGISAGLIDSRGDIRIFGNDQIEIAIQHPRDKEKFIEKIKLSNKGVATSGDYKQFNENFDKSHIINKKEFISVTVVAESLTEADLFATALMVLPKNKAEELLKKNKKIRALSIDKDLKVVRYNDF